MNNYAQNIFYFNYIKTCNIDTNLIQILKRQEWSIKYIVLNTQMFIVKFISYKEKIFIQSICDYYPITYKSLFNLSFAEWNTNKIVEIIEYN